MFSDLEAALSRLAWRLSCWVVIALLRIFWLPLLIIAAAYFIVGPVLGAVAELLPLLVQPAAALAVAMLVLWMWRRP